MVDPDIMRRFTVVHAAETIRGGIASYLREILPRQVARYGADRVAVVTVGEQIGDLGNIPGVVFVTVSRARSRVLTAWRVRGYVRKLLHETGAEILHLHSSFAGLVLRFMPGLLYQVRAVVYCPHGWAFVRKSGSAAVAARVERLLSRRCDAIICVSESERRAALRVGIRESKLRVILNGLPDAPPPAATAPLPSAAPLQLLFVGRFDRAKGFDVLVDAMRRVGRGAEVDVFGESVLGEGAPGDLPDGARLHGWQPFAAIAPFLQRCDALVMPSRWEALGISAIEAMRAGKAVIASRVGGLPELVEDGVTGYLVPPDDAAALAQVIGSAQRDRLAEMGARGRQRFLEKLRIEQCEASLAAVYHEVLTRRQSGEHA